MYGFNYEKRCIHLGDFWPECGWVDIEPDVSTNYGDKYDIPISVFKKKLKDHIGVALESNFFEEIDSILKVGGRIRALREEISDERWPKDEENLAITFHATKSLHNSIGNLQVKVKEVFSEYRKKGSIVDRVLPNIGVVLYMNEKEVGILGFPNIDGSFDYCGFTSKDESFLKWCKDLHEYYWSLGKSRDEFYIK